MIARVPCLLPFPELWLPCGPRARVRREPCAWPWEVRGPWGRLEVDATLPCPAAEGREGPGGLEAELLREALRSNPGSLEPCALVVEALPLLPGAARARRVAARALLGLSPEQDPASRALASGVAQGALPPEGVRLAELGERLLLWRDPVAADAKGGVLPLEWLCGGEPPAPPPPAHRARALAGGASARGRPGGELASRSGPARGPLPTRRARGGPRRAGSAGSGAPALRARAPGLVPGARSPCDPRGGCP